MSILLNIGTYDGRVMALDCGKSLDSEDKNDSQEKNAHWLFSHLSHNGCVKTVDGKNNILVSGSTDDTCRIFDLKQLKDIGTLIGHDGAGVSYVKVLKRNIVTGGADGKICIWRTQDLELLHTIKTKAAVTSLAIDYKEEILVSCHTDKILRVWNLATGNPAGHLPLSLQVQQVEFSKDGEWLAILPNDGLNVQLLQLENERVEQITRSGMGDKFTCIKFLHNILLLGDQKGKVWRVKVGGKADMDTDMDSDMDSDEENKKRESLEEEEESVKEKGSAEEVSMGKEIREIKEIKGTTDSEEEKESDEESDEGSDEGSDGESDEESDDEGSDESEDESLPPQDRLKILRILRDSGSIDPNTPPPMMNRVRLMSILDSGLIAIVFSSGLVELWNYAEKKLILTVNLSDNIRPTSMALVYIEKEVEKTQQEIAELNLKQLEIELKREKRGMRSGVRDRIQKMEKLEKMVLGEEEGFTSLRKTKDMKKNKKLTKNEGKNLVKSVSVVKSGKKGVKKESYIHKLKEMSFSKLKSEKNAKKQQKVIDKKKLEEYREKEEKKMDEKKKSKEERRKEKLKNKEEKLEKDNRARLDGKLRDGKLPSGTKKRKGKFGKSGKSKSIISKGRGRKTRK